MFIIVIIAESSVPNDSETGFMAIFIIYEVEALIDTAVTFGMFFNFQPKFPFVFYKKSGTSSSHTATYTNTSIDL